MKKGTIVLSVILVVVIALGSGVVGRYNQLVALEETVDGRWAQVENQLQRRADLIPNLVNTVKGYASHEEQVFADVADARSRLLGATTPEAQMEANRGLDSALGRLLAISEAYPQLKADTSFIGSKTNGWYGESHATGGCASTSRFKPGILRFVSSPPTC